MTTEPIPMILHCPECRARHIDEGEFATKSHATHACQSCGFVWRPAVVDTVGVQFLPGFKNESPTRNTESPTPSKPTYICDLCGSTADTLDSGTRGGPPENFWACGECTPGLTAFDGALAGATAALSAVGTQRAGTLVTEGARTYEVAHVDTVSPRPRHTCSAAKGSLGCRGCAAGLPDDRFDPIPASLKGG